MTPKKYIELHQKWPDQSKGKCTERQNKGNGTKCLEIYLPEWYGQLFFRSSFVLLSFFFRSSFLLLVFFRSFFSCLTQYDPMIFVTSLLPLCYLFVILRCTPRCRAFELLYPSVIVGVIIINVPVSTVRNFSLL